VNQSKYYLSNATSHETQSHNEKNVFGESENWNEAESEDLTVSGYVLNVGVK